MISIWLLNIVYKMIIYQINGILYEINMYEGWV